MKEYKQKYEKEIKEEKRKRQAMYRNSWMEKKKKKQN
jgi:hypothetical protein